MRDEMNSIKPFGGLFTLCLFWLDIRSINDSTVISMDSQCVFLASMQ